MSAGAGRNARDARRGSCHGVYRQHWMISARESRARPILPPSTTGLESPTPHRVRSPSCLPSKAHTKVKTSDPVRSRQLSTFGVCQYCGGGPRGNPDWPWFLVDPDPGPGLGFRLHHRAIFTPNRFLSVMPCGLWIYNGSVISLVVMISRCQRDGPGSIPGRRTFSLSCCSLLVNYRSEGNFSTNSP